ncbi:hypothetical protein GF389_06230 [Candidatus Dojkabacteria bacterium]|nr:hypothetical protein [Candidatus Dojkabacteria bacterium]
MKKSIVIAVVILFISISFVSYFFYNRSQEKKDDVRTEKQEKVEFTDIIPDVDFQADWTKYVDKETGLSFSHPKDWVIETVSNSACNPYSNSPSICTNVGTSGGSYISIKIEETHDSAGGGYITKNDYEEARAISLNRGEIEVLRPNYINSVDGSSDIMLQYFTDRYEYVDYNSLGTKKYSEVTNWFVSDGKGYTINYSLDSSIVEDAASIGSNEIIDTMDQIVSTLEIDFEKEIF